MYFCAAVFDTAGTFLSSLTMVARFQSNVYRNYKLHKRCEITTKKIQALEKGRAFFFFPQCLHGNLQKYRFRTVMKNLEKSWTFKIAIFRPGEVLEK